MPTEQEEFDRRSRERDSSSSSSSSGSVPRPDPTARTVEALSEAIVALRTLIDQRISATEALFETKIQAGREGGLALQDLLTREIEALKDFHITDMRGL